MSFTGLESDADPATVDYVFLGEVSTGGRVDAACQGGGLGHYRRLNRVDDDPETRAGTISADCPPGEHVVSVGLYSAETVELARASVAFTVLERPEPTVGVSLAPAGPVAEGTAIAVTMSFGDLASDADTGTIDYIFRADVLDSEDGAADDCEGNGLGVDRNINRVDEDPEVRAGTISADCPAGDYTVRASLSSAEGEELASASADFSVAAPPEPSVSVELSPSDFVEEGNEITATMSFGGLASDSDTSTIDYVVRADVLDSEDGDADDCEGKGLGADRNINQVDDDPEARTGTISAECPAGSYTLRVSISSADDTELASASAGFFILRAPEPVEPPTLTALSVSHGDPAVAVTLSPAFDSATLAYRATVRVAQVTVAPTASDAGATVAYRDGNGDAMADADATADGHQVDLDAGSNTVRVAVSKDSLTTTYTVKLLRLVTQQQGNVQQVWILPTSASTTQATIGEGLTIGIRFNRDRDGGTDRFGIEVTETGNTLTGTIPTIVDFGNGGLVRTLNLSTRDDEAVEADSVVTVRLLADTADPQTYALIDPPTTDKSTSHSVTVLDNDGLGEVPGAPTVSTATVNGATLVLTFNETLSATSTPAAATFTVKVTPDVGSESTRGVTAVAKDAPKGQLTLTLASAVVSTDTVTVSWEDDQTGTGIKDASDSTAEDFTDQAVTNNTPASVAAFVTVIEISSTPAADWAESGEPYHPTRMIYGPPKTVTENGVDRTIAGDAIEVTVTFSEAVTVATPDDGDGNPQIPSLEIDVGGTGKRAYYDRGTGSAELVFSYSVESGDFDFDGFGVKANKLALNGGTIMAGTVAASLDHAAIGSDDEHRVGDIPRITRYELRNIPDDRVYPLNKVADLVVYFSVNVNTPGGNNAARFYIEVDGNERPLAATGKYQDRLFFVHTIAQPGDLDEDGISFRENAFRGSRFFNADNGSQPIFLGFPAWRPPGDAVRVDGRQPTVTNVSVASSPEDGATYRAGESISVELTMNVATLVTRVPHVTLDIGGARRTAAYVGSPAPERMLFSYVVGSGGADYDIDGVELVGDSLSLAGPTDRSSALIISGANPPVLEHRALTLPGGVDAGPRVTAVAVTSSPSAAVYAAGETISVRLTFSEAVVVSGAPEIRLRTLAVGAGRGVERPAVYSSGSGSANLVFSYTVVADDYDSDGIGVHGQDGRISLPGSAAISSAATGAAAQLWFTGLNRVSAAQVDGGGAPWIVFPPEVTSNAPSKRRYVTGETITVAVTFSKTVDVTGAPVLKLNVGGTEKDAAYSSGSGSNRLVFSYTVAGGDEDRDGLSIDADKLSLNGGTIKISGGTADARLGHDAIGNQQPHRVGAVLAAERQFVSNSPAGGDTYFEGETIDIDVTHNEAGSHTVAASREVVIGDNTVTPGLAGHGQHLVRFQHRVRADDYDADGIYLKGSTTRDTGLRKDGKSFDGHLLAAGPFVDAKVDGTAGPAVSGFEFVSSPGRGDTYGLGETIEVAALFDRPMYLSGGAPLLGLAINGWRQAAYARGTGSDRLVFAYTVGAGAVDTDGAGVFTNGIRGGHTIEDRNDRTMPLGPEYSGSTSMVPQSPRADGGDGHKVDDKPRLLSLAFSSDPGADATYEVGEAVEVTAAFSIAVDVTGTPRIGLQVGGESRDASYASGSGTNELVFRYTVADGHTDDDGIAIFENPFRLHGGTITEKGQSTVHARVGQTTPSGYPFTAANPQHKTSGGAQTPQSSDATLSALTLVNAADDAAIALTPTFVSGTTHEGYTASVASGVATATVTATPTHDEAEAVITPADADADTAGHQVALTPGRDTVITVAVTAEDGSDKTYTVTVTRARATVTIIADAATAGEGDALSFTVTRSPVAADELEVKLNVSETGTFVPPGNEGMKTVTIPADTASAKHTVTTDAGDDDWDAHSTVTAALLAETRLPLHAGRGKLRADAGARRRLPHGDGGTDGEPEPGQRGRHGHGDRHRHHRLRPDAPRGWRNHHPQHGGRHGSGRRLRRPERDHVHPRAGGLQCRHRGWEQPLPGRLHRHREHRGRRHPGERRGVQRVDGPWQRPRQPGDAGHADQPVRHHQRQRRAGVVRRHAERAEPERSDVHAPVCVRCRDLRPATRPTAWSRPR